LSEQYSFPLPPTLVETEFQTIWNRLVDDNNHPENTDKVDLENAAVKAELDAEYRNIAERRVMLGLVIAKIAEKENIRLTQEYIYRVLFQEAMRYPGQQQQVLKYFKDNPAAVETLVSPHIEHFVIEFLLNTLDTPAKEVTKSEMHGLFAGVLPGFEGDDAEPKAEKAKKAAPKAKKKAADAE
jgi:trigger factor